MTTMTAQDVEDRCALLGSTFRIQWATLHFDHYRNMTADYVGPHDVYDSEAAAPEGARPFVDLGSIAAGDDQYDQVSTWRRSNFRSLQRDYPEVWTLVCYSNVHALGAYVQDLSEDLIRTLCSLQADYPVYDESDVSDLEDAEIREAWDQYLRADTYRALDDEWTDRWDALDAAGEQALEDAFWRYLNDADYYPEHSGLDVRWDDDVVNAAVMAAIEAAEREAAA